MTALSDVSRPTSSRPLHPTMGQGVAERTYLRRLLTEGERALSCPDGIIHLSKRDPFFRKWYVAALNSYVSVVIREDAPHHDREPETVWETWHQVADRVAEGNVSVLFDRATSIAGFEQHVVDEYHALSSMIADGRLLLSGRHLQQGDKHQRSRGMAAFSNCSTAPTSFALFTLLLNGSGVGRDYSDSMMVVDWCKHLPNIVVVLDENHPDFQWDKHTSLRDAQHLYSNYKGVLWHTVADSREGWGKSVEIVETATFMNGLDVAAGTDPKVSVIVLDYSKVRGRNEPIMGMQGRPSSGPAPLMEAMTKINRLRGANLPPWRASMIIDHYLAEPVLVGGARRSARMSTKYWKDADILDFAGIKRPIEYHGKTEAELKEYLDTLTFKPMSHLWSSNNSVAVDAEFWERASDPHSDDPLTLHARVLYRYITECAYHDGTGEPGFVNVDRLVSKGDFTDPRFAAGEYIGSKNYTVEPDTKNLLIALFEAFQTMPYRYIVNPCAEITLSILGGFCVIADVVPFHASNLEEVEDAVRAATRAMIRVNTMDSIYAAEVMRTNRIGISLTGVHEAAWKFFRVGFKDMVNPELRVFTHTEDRRHSENGSVRASAFWDWLGFLSQAVRDESVTYSEFLGVQVPHTCTTIKPSGTVSKLFGITEGWHLPAMRHYIRWVQYHANSPMIAEYRDKGYPVRELKTYRDHLIVGFPTEPVVCQLGMGDALVTAGEASVEDQFRWLRLGEYFWIEGGSVSEHMMNENRPGETLPSVDVLIKNRGYSYGNQISYTLKYLPDETDFQTFFRMIRDNQPYVRCCSVMPQVNTSLSAYEYLPEEQVSVAEYEHIQSAIRKEGNLTEDVGLEHLDCSTGACPVVFESGDKSNL